MRIAAARAGQQNGDDWDDDPEAEAWGVPPARRKANDDDGPREGKRGRRRSGGGRQEWSAPVAAPTTVPPPAARPAGPGLPSAARLKVLRQRRRRRRVLIAFTFLAAVLTFTTGVGYAYIDTRLGQINRLNLPGLAVDSSGAAMNILLVGSDSQARPSGAEAAQGIDTVMILHLGGRDQKSAIVSIPRDLYVPIPGTGQADRLSAAFALGGPDQLISSVRSVLGVTINHYMQIEFSGFKDIVDAVGGVTVSVASPARDTLSGLALDRGGCVRLDGRQGLSWLRSRQMEFLVGGSWQQDGRGDLGRTERQQDLILRVMTKALSPGITDPIQLNRLAGAGVRYVTLDSALSTRGLAGLGRRLGSLDPAAVVRTTLPTSPLDVGGKAVLSVRLAEAQPVFDLLNGSPAAPASPAVPGAPTSAGPTTVGPTTTAAPKASDVKVRVLNGLGTPGAAAKAANSLTTLGFSVADKGDAPSISAKTTIMYAAGQLAKAQLLQGSLVTPAVVKEDATLKAVDVNLVLGGDYTGVRSGISSGTSAAPTTAAPTTAVPNTAGVSPGAAQPGGAGARPC